MAQLHEFRSYVETSGVDFNHLSHEEKRQWRETFDKSFLVKSGQLQLLMDQQQHMMNVVTRLAEDVTHLSEDVTHLSEDVTHLSGEIHAGDAFIIIHS